MQSRQTTTLYPGHSNSLRRVRGLSSLQNQALAASQRDSMPLADPTMLMVPRAPSPRLSHGSSIIDFSSRVLQGATASPETSHPLEVSRATPSTEPQVVQPTSNPNNPDTTTQPTRARRNNSRSSHHRRAYALDGRVYSSGPTGSRVPVPRLNNVLSKPPGRVVKPAHRALRSRFKTFARSLMFRRGASAVKKRLQISSPFNPIHMYEDPVSGGHLEMVRYPNLVVEAPAPTEQASLMGVEGPDRPPTRAGWEAEGSMDPLRSNKQETSSLKLVHSTISQRHNSKKDEISRLLKDNSRLREEIVRLQELHKVQLRQVQEKHEFQLVQKKEAYHMEINQERIRSNHYENKCKNITIETKSRETQLKSRSVRDQFRTLKNDIAVLEARLVAEQVKSSNHRARCNHYKMMYEMEIKRQSRAGAVVAAAAAAAVVPGCTPVVLAEVTLRGGGAQQEYEASLPQSEQDPPPESQQPTVITGSYRADVMCPTSMEAQNPFTEPSMAEIMSLPATTTTIRTVSVRELPSPCTSPCVVNGNGRYFQAEVTAQVPLTIANSPSLPRPSEFEQLQVDDALLDDTEVDMDVETGVEMDVISRLNTWGRRSMPELGLVDPRVRD